MGGSDCRNGACEYGALSDYSGQTFSEEVHLCGGSVFHLFMDLHGTCAFLLYEACEHLFSRVRNARSHHYYVDFSYWSGIVIVLGGELAHILAMRAKGEYGFDVKEEEAPVPCKRGGGKDGKEKT